MLEIDTGALAAKVMDANHIYRLSGERLRPPVMQSVDEVPGVRTPDKPVSGRHPRAHPDPARISFLLIY